MKKKVLIVGANGVVGFAAMKHFSNDPETEVVAISRKKPTETFGVTFYSVDLLNNEQCATVLGNIKNVTHIIYCAVFEKKSLRNGWLDNEQIENNENMLKNLMVNISNENNQFKHITLLQGSKAYGTQIGEFVVPARENKSERKDIPNFYWKQEEYIVNLQKEKEWSYTILRPRIVFGEAIGSAMNIITALGVYASVLKKIGEPLHFPGSQTKVIHQAVDADLLAQAIEWAGNSLNAQNKIFNITNGDVFVWYNIWPSIARAFNMEVGSIKPMYMKKEMSKYNDVWDNIRREYNLESPGMDDFVNSSFEYADGYFHADENQTPHIVSTVEIYKNGFNEAVHTEEMFVKWFDVMQKRNLLPTF